MSAPHLPPHPSLEQLKKRAKDLRKACQAGDAAALNRIRKNLPRLARATDAEIAAGAVVLQEAQHVVATEQGFKNWNWLQMVVELDLGVLARLTDREIQTLMHDADQRDIMFSLTTASEAARNRLLANMSERVQGHVESEMAYLKATAAQVEEAQRRVLMAAADLASRGQIEWPPANGEFPGPAGCAEAAEPSMRLLELAGSRLDDLSTEAIVELMAEVAEAARRDGMLALDAIAEKMVDPFVQEAVRLAVDGTEPDLLTDMLRTRSERALLVQQETRGRMVVEATMAIQSGDNPRVIHQKMSALYQAAAPPDSRTSLGDSTGQLQKRLRQRLGSTPYDSMELGLTAEVLTDMGQLARREGVGTLAPLRAIAGDTLLGRAIGMAVDGVQPDEVMTALERQLQEELNESRMRQRMVTTGMAALQQGRTPAQVEAEVRDIA